MVHEGGYTIQRIDNNARKLKEQFVRQQRTDDISLFDFETALRNSTDSFNAVRKLSPTRYRFRIVDSQGNDVLDQPNTHFTNAKNWPAYQPHMINKPIYQPHGSAHASIHDSMLDPAHNSALHDKHESTPDSTHIEHREPVPNEYYIGNQKANEYSTVEF